MILRNFLAQTFPSLSLEIISFDSVSFSESHQRLKDFSSLISYVTPSALLKVDSRTICPGDVFLSIEPLLPETKMKYLKEAQDRGAIFAIQGLSSRLLWSKWARECYPQQPFYCVGVTGTSGKSSVVNFVRQLWEISGLKAASIGTLGLISNSIETEQFPEVTLTSPDAMILHTCLDQLSHKQVNHVALEVSSHGLDQRRLDAVQFHAAAFTNFSHEHLDYHGTLEAYFETKSHLFSELLPSGSFVILNLDDPYSQKIIEICKKKSHSIIGFGYKASELKLLDINSYTDGLKLTLNIKGDKRQIDVPLIGSFQAYNILAALGLGIASGLDLETALCGISLLKTVPGRMEYVGQTRKGGRVFVDYAHKPQALEQVLKSLRPHTAGKISVVFGCGGNRDTAKRQMMGKIAAQNAERVIVTDDNPRFEDPDFIRSEILKGCPNAQEIPSRAQAIRSAIQQLKKDDICIIAGKGHEKGQIVGEKVFPFEDREVVLSSLY